MGAPFRHAVIVGKYQARGIRPMLEEIAHFLMDQGLEVSFDRETAQATGVTDFEALSPAEMGQRCDLAIVVGGDGTMLGIARELARWKMPLVGINQGRLGFITDIAASHYRDALAPMVAGDYEEENRSMLEGDVWRDGDKIFEGLSLNDVVVSRGATASMVELRVDVDEVLGRLAQLRHGGRAAVDPGAALALRVDRAAQQQRVVDREAGFVQPGLQRGRRVELGADLGAAGALAHQRRVGAVAQGQLQRVDQDGLASAGLAGEHCEAGTQLDLELGDDHHVAQGQSLQHGYTTPSYQRSFLRKVA